MIFHRFPVDYQMDSQDCGPACLKIIAKHFGRYYSLQYLRDRCGITNQGISLLDLSTGAESIGLRTLAIKCTLEDVSLQFFSGKTLILLLSIMPIRNTYGYLIRLKDALNTLTKNSKKDGIRKEQPMAYFWQ